MTTLFFTLAVTAASLLPTTGPGRVPYEFHHENVLGTSLTLKFYADSPADADRAEAAALAEIDRLAAILSSYDASSEFSRWTRTLNEPVRVSPELLEVLALYDDWRSRTGGAVSAAFTGANGGTHWRLDRANGTATHLSNGITLKNLK